MLRESHHQIFPLSTTMGFFMSSLLVKKWMDLFSQMSTHALPLLFPAGLHASFPCALRDFPEELLKEHLDLFVLP